MAKRYEDTEQEVLLDFAKTDNGECIRVSKITGKDFGTVKVDIRRYYTDKEGNLAPTQKGVRFDIENLTELCPILMKLVEKTAQSEDWNI